MFECPLCGATSNRKGRAFGSVESVVAHIDAKNDDVHAGETGAEHRERILEVEDDPEPSDEPDDAETPSTMASQEEETLPETPEEPASSEPEPDPAPEPEVLDAEPVEPVQQESSMTDTGEESPFSDSEQHHEPIEVESTVQDLPATPETGCPLCGGSLVQGEEGMTWFGADGDILGVEGSDRICEQCDVLVEPDGSIHWGSESEEAEYQLTCSDCGVETVHPDHAVYVLSAHHENMSGFRFLSRRRIRKVARRLQKWDPDHVCPNCWNAYGVA